MGKSTIDSVRDMIWPCTKLIQIAHFPYKVCGNRAALNTLIILYKYILIFMYDIPYFQTHPWLFIGFLPFLVDSQHNNYLHHYLPSIRLLGESIWINLDHPKIEPRWIITIKPRCWLIYSNYTLIYIYTLWWY